MFLRGLPDMTYVLLDPVERRTDDDEGTAALLVAPTGVVVLMPLCCGATTGGAGGLKVMGNGSGCALVFEAAIDDQVADYADGATDITRRLDTMLVHKSCASVSIRVQESKVGL